MRAAVLTRFGGPDAVEVRDVPDPEPGPGQVRLSVLAAATNNTDLWTREGAYGTDDEPDAKSGWKGVIDFPRIQGADVVGRVDAVGDGVDEALIGRRMLVDPRRTPIWTLPRRAAGPASNLSSSACSAASTTAASPSSASSTPTTSATSRTPR